MLINKNLTLQAKSEVMSNPLVVSCRESVMEHKTSFYGQFYIGPLENGQGLTLANALRRSLLSELSGLAVTSIEIEGVSHEYSTLVGVRESVLDILLNLKQVVLKSKTSLKRPQTAYLYCQGPGVIRAGDLFLPSLIQCVDPEQYIATLSSDGILKMKLIIRQGKNYLVQTPSSFDSSSFVPKNTEVRTLFSGLQKKDKKIKHLQKKHNSYFSQKIHGNGQNDNSKSQNRQNINFNGDDFGFTNSNEKNAPIKSNNEHFSRFDLFLLSFKKFVSRSTIANSSFEYKIFLKNLYSNNSKNQKLKIGSNQKRIGSDKNQTLFLKNKKVCLFKVKNYRSLNKIFENSKNKNWFINLFKKQILYILAIKLSKINSCSSFNEKKNNFSSSFLIQSQVLEKNWSYPLCALSGSANNSNLISNLIKVVKYLETQPGTYCSNFKYFPQLNFENLFFSLQSKVSYTNTTKPLFIDAVFMPVRKVNYVLEESKQKLFNDIYFNITNQFSISNFDNFEQNLSKSIPLEQSNNKKNSKTNSLHVSSTQNLDSPSLNNDPENLFFGDNYWSLFCLDVTSKQNNQENFYSEFLFDQFNQSPKDIIILEIWTNGSILPRTALKCATKNLTNLLIQFQHAKTMKNTFFETKKTYIKTINKLYEKYQYPNF